MRWDVFCRVVDNHGDLGVCWRLSADLAARGEAVRLWVDDATALAWMAPPPVRQGVEIVRWADSAPPFEPGDVVIEAFGCDPPPAFIDRMARRRPAPVWINLEYLSAENYVERSHRLPSPQSSGPGAGLVKRFWYPGFTRRTGGLIREPGLLRRQSRFDGDAWLHANGCARRPDERVVTLFCYANATLPALLDTLAREPTLLLATTGFAEQQVRRQLGPAMRRRALRAAAVAPVSQIEFDHLLWASDLNFVRGEDSFVRAQWAAKPFVWQIYPQSDDAHLQKLDAFLDRLLHDAPLKFSGSLRRLWNAWNGNAEWPVPAEWPDIERWRQLVWSWRNSLAANDDLTSQLLQFVGDAK